MRSIGFRLARGYALSTAITLGVMLALGYRLLEDRLIHGLDHLNAAEFAKISARLDDGNAVLTPTEVERRIRETTDDASVLFYINIQSKESAGLFQSSNLNGQSIPDVKGRRVFTVRMTEPGELRVGEFVMRNFDVEIATPTAQMRSVMAAYVEVSLALFVMLLAASVAIGMSLSRILLGPLRDIQETASRIGSDNLGERIPIGAVDDELSNLARLLNNTLSRLESAFSEMRRFAAEASHELKTPLSLVRLHAERLALADADTVTCSEIARDQLEELDRLTKIIDGLLFLSRAEAKAIALNCESHRPEAFLADFLPDAAALAEHEGCRFAIQHEGQAAVGFDQGRLRQVLLNLLTNALHVSRPGDTILLTSCVDDAAWHLEMLDEGPGLAPADCERIFERFVRLETGGDAAPGGSGLGLAISRSIVQLHGGQLYAQARQDRIGLSLVILLPA